MTASHSDALQEAQSDLRTAQSESDAHRRGQYVRSAVDAATQIVLDTDVDEGDRAGALVVLQAAQAMIPGVLLDEARAVTDSARAETDPRRKRELARSAVAKARSATTHSGVTAEELAQARMLIGQGRMVETETFTRVRGHDRQHDLPGIAI